MFRRVKFKIGKYRFKIIINKPEEITGNVDKMFALRHQSMFRRILFNITCRSRHWKSIQAMDINEVVYYLLMYFNCFDNEKIKEYCDKFGIK